MQQTRYMLAVLILNRKKCRGKGDNTCCKVETAFLITDEERNTKPVQPWLKVIVFQEWHLLYFPHT